MLADLKIYIESINKGKLAMPKCKSFSVVRCHLNDKLLSLKLNIFLYVAKIIEPFMIKYQSDKPLVPFLADDIKIVLISLLEIFIKPDVLKRCNSSLKLANLDFENVKNHVKPEAINIGFVASRELKSLYTRKAVTDGEIFNLKMDFKNAVIHILRKLMDKSPITYSLVRQLDCLSPAFMTKNKDSCLNKMKLVLSILCELNQLCQNDCDEILPQFKNFLNEALSENFSLFSNFEYHKGIDSLLINTMNVKKYEKLWSVVKNLLLLSHGQASVERGFSVNKRIVVENMKEHSYISQRLICEHYSHGDNITITKELRMHVSGARKKYMLYLDELKHQNLQKEKEKRSLEEVELENKLNKKKKMIEDDIKQLLQSADDYAKDAERCHNFSLIVKSNSMRRYAEEKKIELSNLERNKF